MNKKIHNDVIDFVIPLIEIITIIIVGILVKDLWFRLIISSFGILFNYLVCASKRYGFLIGIIYALAYGVMSIFDMVYASAFFMIIIQAPMAVISFINWKKDKNITGQLKKTSTNQSIFIVVCAIAFYVIICLVLKLINGSGVLFDAFFLTTSLISCILLAKYYRVAYVYIMLSGVGGVGLWLYQFITLGEGITVVLLNAFILINAIIGIVKNYSKKKVF